MSKIEILLPTVSLFPRSTFWAMDMAKKAGFDGVEVLLWPKGSAINSVLHAERLELKAHFHQCWSLEENPTHLFNHVLAFVGVIEKGSIPLSIQIKGVGNNPVVVYGDRIEEVSGMDQYFFNIWLQTDSTLNEDGTYRLSFETFIEFALAETNPIVFDTQHVLEWKSGKCGVENLRGDNLLDLKLRSLWSDLGHRVREIHLCDFDPELGHDKGRNLFPGLGVLKLGEFARDVVDSGWTGTVVPEVAPSLLWNLNPMATLSYLRKLREEVERLFFI